LKRELEALLFATDAPLTAARLRKIFPESTTAEFKAAVAELQGEYDAGEHAFTVVEFGGGWQIATRPDFAPVVENLLRVKRVARLSKAGLEVLAIIAYRQPLTRLEIDEIRGVNSSGALATLSERHLITVVGRSKAEGNPLLYGTTREFLNHLGLRALGQLPDLPELEKMVDDPERLKNFAIEIGRDIADEDLDDYFADAEVLPEDVAGDTDLEQADGSDLPDVATATAETDPATGMDSVPAAAEAEGAQENDRT